MFTYIRKHQKKFMVVFSVLLMVIFVATSNTGQSGGRAANPVFAHAGSEKLLLSDYQDAHAEWQMLSRIPIEVPTQYGMRQVEFPKILLGVEGFNQVTAHPELFMLLKHEAKRMNVHVSNDNVQTILQNQILPNHKPADADEMEQLKAGVTDLLMIDAAYKRIANTVKVSAPVRDHFMAASFQRIRVELADYSAAEFAGRTAAPTTQQVTDQFNKYSTVEGGTPTKENPFGFGYKFPNRVKLQFITINRDAVKTAVESQKSAYDWEVAARRQYAKNPSLYTSTTRPAGASTTQPATPTTKPFSEAKDEVLSDLRRPLEEKMLADVQTKILSAMAADWVAYHRANPEGSAASTTQPASDYTSFEYLRKLAASVQQQFNLLPETNDIASDYKTAKDLSLLPGIGRAQVIGAAQGATLALYVEAWAKPFVPADRKDKSDVLNVYEPGKPLMDQSDNIYIFRLTDAKPAEVPTDISQVRAQVESDLKDLAGYNAAKEAANGLLTSAKATSLTSAAAAANRMIFPVGPFTSQPGDPVLGYTLSETARPVFVTEAFKLLALAARSGEPHPIGLIELPQDRKTIVARLQDVQPMWNADNEYMARMEAGVQIRTSFERLLQAEWFNWDSVVKRLDYRPDNSGQKTSAS